MGYYIRILGTSLTDTPIQRLQEVASPALIDAEKASAETWDQLVLRHPSGQEIAIIERNPIVEGELGADDLEEFLEEIRSFRPQSAVEWLQHYLPRVKVIYAFQLLSGTDILDGWSRMHQVYSTIWGTTGGILQADGEGFSNEQGYTILWQFGEAATGKWNVGVLADGAWKHFQIDLGNQQHREAFWNGEVPAGSNLL